MKRKIILFSLLLRYSHFEIIFARSDSFQVKMSNFRGFVRYTI